ncbi:MAG: diaminopimelate epimerase [Acidimicrobiales bacterium]
MKLTKHHGLRNDFLVVLDETNDAPVTAGPELARVLCDRRSGIGADGLIHGAAPGPGDEPGSDVVMRLWNADGSRAEMSGNGIRCLAQAVSRARGWASGTIVAATDAGPRQLEVIEGPSPREVGVRVDMGAVGAGPGTTGIELPFATKEVATADLGNPHLVAWVDDPDGVDLESVGPVVESAFPDGINLEVIAPGTVPGTLSFRVWERGVGVTEACGTGACAAAFIAHQWGLVNAAAEVAMPGGTVLVELVDGRALLHGPAVHIADIEIDDRELADG